jgi:hypothetical protein
MSGIVPTTNIARANITLEIGVGLQVPNSKKPVLSFTKKVTILMLHKSCPPFPLSAKARVDRRAER